MIETLLQELTQALKDNTAAINTMLAAGETKPEKPVAKKAKAAKPEPTPEPTPEPEPEPEPEQPEVINTTPTKVAVTKAVDDTPSVPAKTPPEQGQPIAAEHVDVDEVLAQINTIVKGKLMSGDTAAMRNKWEQIRKGKYGVDRMSDLKNDPAKLIAALADAKAL